MARGTKSGNVCVAVWDAEPRCRGWNEAFGTVLHGCSKNPSHADEHRCKCGDVCQRGRDRIFPRYNERGEVV